MYAINTLEFTHNGRQFVARTYDDDYQAPPWMREGGHGIVTDWESRDKRPGEWVLCEGGHSKRFYDAQQTMTIALRDGWGPQIEGQTKRQSAAAGVRADFERMRAWCNDEWRYIGVSVMPVGADGDLPDEEYEHTCWGVESDGDYWEDVARELADEVALPESQSEDCGV